jgi:RluA family pseudouridine synthase
MDRRRRSRRTERTAVAHTVSQSEDGQRLDASVAAWLADALGYPLSKSVVRKTIMAGAVRLNGLPVRRPGLVLRADMKLDVRIDAARLPPFGDRHAGGDPEPPAVLYEDDDLVAVAKPPGLVMHATADPHRRDLFSAVRRSLALRPAEARSTAGLPYLGLHHRLDVDTSGIVLFTKRERSNGPLAAQFQHGEVKKVYHAIVCQPRHALADAWRIENRLATSGGGRRARMRAARTGGVRAATGFVVLDRLAAALLVEARPETGRKHQIRAHLSDAGMPILGDSRYGGPRHVGPCTASRVMLHASRLSLRHPVTGLPLDLTCPYPPDFAALLDCLRGRL